MENKSKAVETEKQTKTNPQKEEGPDINIEVHSDNDGA